MKTKILLTLTLLLAATTSALAQTGAGATAPKPAATAAAPTRTKIAIVDVLAFRESVGELKAKYEKLQTEFAPRYREVEAMQNSITTKEKVLGENKNLTPQQAGKLTEEIAQLKKDYERYVQDSQDIAQKRERAETEAIYDKLSKFLEQYCTKHGITQVFDARRLQETNIVIYAAPTANITADFIKEYNKANPGQAASNK
jgi:Skp family chaperone for outer membrane proteins